MLKLDDLPPFADAPLHSWFGTFIATLLATGVDWTGAGSSSAWPCRIHS